MVILDIFLCIRELIARTGKDLRPLSRARSIMSELFLIFNIFIQKKKDFFSFYFYDSGENSNAYNLVALSSGGREWVSFKPKTDYLFIVRNYINDNDFQQYLNKIKSILKVNHAYVIDLELNNKIDIILEDIEFHEMRIMDEINKRFD